MKWQFSYTCTQYINTRPILHVALRLCRASTIRQIGESQFDIGYDMNVRERRGRVLEPHCVVSLSKTHINPSLVLVQSRNTCPYITERLLMDV